jgi:hypothetical protein
MRPLTARRLALAALIPALLVLSVIPGCSNQSEGERCGGETTASSSDSDDCESGLVCTRIAEKINRCCYPDHVTDSRCVIGGSPSATSHGGGSSVGEAGASSIAGGGASGAASEAGAPSVTPDSGAAGTATDAAGAGGS